MHRRAMAVVLAASMAFVSVGAGSSWASPGSDVWSAPLTLGWAYTTPPLAAAGPTGDAVVVYDASVMFTTALGASSYRPGLGWSPPQMVSGAESAAIDYTALAVGPDGTAVAVWSYYDSGANATWVWAAEHSPEFGWGAPQVLTYAAGYCGSPKVAVDAENTKTAAWVCLLGPSAVIYSATSARGGLWSDVGFTANTGEFIAAYDLVAGGNVTAAVWVATDTVNTTVMAARHTLARGWEDADPLQKLSSIPSEVTGGVSANGEVMVVWRGNAGFGQTIYYASRAWSGSFTPAIEVQRDPAEVTHIAFARHPDGGAELVFTILASRSQVWAAKWTTGPVFEAPVPVFQDANLSAVNIAVAMDESGTAVAAWSTTHYDTNLSWDVQDVWVSRNDVADGWSAPAMQPAPSSVESIQPSVAAGGGTAVVAWFARTFSTGQIAYAARYEVKDRTAPQVEVYAPAEGATVQAATVTVTGRAEAGAVVRVGGVVAPVGSDGLFRLDVAVPEGAFQLNVTATDAAGNVGLNVMHLQGADPAVALQAEVDAAQAESAAAQANASAAAADASAARAQIAVADANATAARAATADMSLNVTQLQVQVDGLQEDLRLSNVELNQTRNDLRSSTTDVTAIAGQLAALSIFATAALLAALAGIGLTIITQRRASAAKVEVKGWDPKKKEE